MISVIIPVYNGEKYIKDALMSVIRQQFKDVEIIVINDGSTDSTLSVVESIWEQYTPKGKVISIENGGLANARNIGIEASNGDFICNLDADDFLESDIFMRVFSEVGYDFDVCYYGYRDVDKSGKTIMSYEARFQYHDCITGLEAAKLKLKKKIWVCQGSAIYRKKLLKNKNIYNIRGVNQGEDLFFITSMLAASDNVRCLNTIGVNIRVLDSSMMHSSFNKTFLQSLKAVDNLREKIKSFDDEHKDKELLDLVSVQSMEEICGIAKKMIRSKNKTLFRMIKDINGLYNSEFDNLLQFRYLIVPRKYIEYSIFKYSKIAYYFFVVLHG